MSELGCYVELQEAGLLLSCRQAFTDPAEVNGSTLRRFSRAIVAGNILGFPTGDGVLE